MWIQTQHHKNLWGSQTQHHKNWYGSQINNLQQQFTFVLFFPSLHCLHVVLELVWTTRKPRHVIVTYIDLSTTYGTRLHRNSILRSHSSPSPSSYLVITNLRQNVMLSSVKSPQSSSPSQRYSRGTQCPLLHVISWLPLHFPGGAAQHDVMMTLHNDAHVLTSPAWAKCWVCAWCHYSDATQQGDLTVPCRPCCFLCCG